MRKSDTSNKTLKLSDLPSLRKSTSKRIKLERKREKERSIHPLFLTFGSKDLEARFLDHFYGRSRSFRMSISAFIGACMYSQFALSQDMPWWYWWSTDLIIGAWFAFLGILFIVPCIVRRKCILEFLIVISNIAVTTRTGLHDIFVEGITEPFSPIKYAIFYFEIAYNMLLRPRVITVFPCVIINALFFSIYSVSVHFSHSDDHRLIVTVCSYCLNELFVYMFLYTVNRTSREAFLKTDEILERNAFLEHQIGRTKHLLENILPSSFIPEIIDGELERNNHCIIRQIQDGCLLQCDLVGFTSWSSKEDCATVTAILNLQFSYYDTICTKMNLEKTKTCGDSFECFGKSSKDFHSICLLGIGIIEAVRRVNEEKRTSLAVRVGICSGKFTCTCLGSVYRHVNFDIFGVQTFFCTKLEETARPNSVHIDHGIYKKTKDDFRYLKFYDRNFPSAQSFIDKSDGGGKFELLLQSPNKSSSVRIMKKKREEEKKEEEEEEEGEEDEDERSSNHSIIRIVNVDDSKVEFTSICDESTSNRKKTRRSKHNDRRSTFSEDDVEERDFHDDSTNDTSKDLSSVVSISPSSSSDFEEEIYEDDIYDEDEEEHVYFKKRKEEENYRRNYNNNMKKKKKKKQKEKNNSLSRFVVTKRKDLLPSIETVKKVHEDVIVVESPVPEEEEEVEGEGTKEEKDLFPDEARTNRKSTYIINMYSQDYKEAIKNPCYRKKIGKILEYCSRKFHPKRMKAKFECIEDSEIELDDSQGSNSSGSGESSRRSSISEILPSMSLRNITEASASSCSSRSSCFSSSDGGGPNGRTGMDSLCEWDGATFGNQTSGSRNMNRGEEGESDGDISSTESFQRFAADRSRNTLTKTFRIKSSFDASFRWTESTDVRGLALAFCKGSKIFKFLSKILVILFRPDLVLLYLFRKLCLSKDNLCFPFMCFLSLKKERGSWVEEQKKTLGSKSIYFFWYFLFHMTVLIYFLTTDRVSELSVRPKVNAFALVVLLNLVFNFTSSFISSFGYCVDHWSCERMFRRRNSMDDETSFEESLLRKRRKSVEAANRSYISNSSGSTPSDKPKKKKKKKRRFLGLVKKSLECGNSCIFHPSSTSICSCVKSCSKCCCFNGICGWLYDSCMVCLIPISNCFQKLFCCCYFANWMYFPLLFFNLVMFRVGHVLLILTQEKVVFYDLNCYYFICNILFLVMEFGLCLHLKTAIFTFDCILLVFHMIWNFERIGDVDLSINELQLGMIGIVAFLLSNYIKEINIRVTYSKQTTVMKKNILIKDEKKKSETLIYSVLPKDIVLKIYQNGFRSFSSKFNNSFVCFMKVDKFVKNMTDSNVNVLLEFLSGLFLKFDEIVDHYNCMSIKKIQEVYLFISREHFLQESRMILDHVLSIIDNCRDVFKNDVENINDKVVVYPIELKIGLTHGIFQSGVLGRNRFLFDIFGDCVNLSARLCCCSENCKITVSDEDLRFAIDSSVVLERRGDIFLKGKGVISCSFIEKRKRKKLSVGREKSGDEEEEVDPLGLSSSSSDADDDDDNQEEEVDFSGMTTASVSNVEDDDDGSDSSNYD